MSQTTALAPSSSAVQTHLKNNTFLLSFIWSSGLCSYFWVVLVSDWNLLPLFPHSFVSEGIRDVYGSGWTLRGQLYTINTSWWLRPIWASSYFSALLSLVTAYFPWQRMTRQGLKLKNWVTGLFPQRHKRAPTNQEIGLTYWRVFI